MSTDDVTVNLINTGTPGGDLSVAGTLMAVGETQRGPIGAGSPILLRSPQDYTSRCLARVTYGFVFDAAEQFFGNARGNGAMYVSRVVGVTPVAANFTLLDATNASSLTVKAGYKGLEDPGDWANGAAGGITVQVTHPTTGFALTVRLGGVIVEQTPEFFALAGIADAIAWANANSRYLKLSDPGAVAIPKVVAATNLVSGTDDRGTVGTAQWQAGLDALTDDYGIGQVAICGVTTTAVQQALDDHCETHNRIPLNDFADTPSAATVAAQPASLTGTGKRRAFVSAPWRQIPAIAAGTAPRAVPGSASIAGILARNDGSGDVPAVWVAPSDDNGVDLVAIGLTQSYSKADRALLEAANVNRVVINTSGDVQVEGNDTLADPTSDPQWEQLTAARTIMWAKWACTNLVGVNYRRKLNDPKRSLIGHFGQELLARVVQPLADNNAIQNDPSIAVDVGPSVNTATTIAAKQLLALVTIQPTGTVDAVTINVLVEA